MKKFLLSLTVLSLSVFLGGASLLGTPAMQDSSTPQESTGTANAKVTVHQRHRVRKPTSTNYTAKYASGVQSLSGTVSMVDAGQKLVVITGSDGTPFNFKVTHATKIELNGKKGTLDALSDQTSKQVEVKYRDRLNAGLVAQSIDVTD